MNPRRDYTIYFAICREIPCDQMNLMHQKKIIIYLKTAVIGSHFPVPESESAESLSCSWSVQFYIEGIGPNQSGRFEAL